MQDVLGRLPKLYQKPIDNKCPRTQNLLFEDVWSELSIFGANQNKHDLLRRE